MLAKYFYCYDEDSGNDTEDEASVVDRGYDGVKKRHDYRADLADVEEGKEDCNIYRIKNILLHDCQDLNLWAKVRRILEIW